MGREARVRQAREVKADKSISYATAAEIAERGSLAERAEEIGIVLAGGIVPPQAAGGKGG